MENNEISNAIKKGLEKMLANTNQLLIPMD